MSGSKLLESPAFCCYLQMQDCRYGGSLWSSITDKIRDYQKWYWSDYLFFCLLEVEVPSRTIWSIQEIEWTNVTGKSNQVWLILGVHFLLLLAFGMGFISQKDCSSIYERWHFSTPNQNLSRPNGGDFLYTSLYQFWEYSDRSCMGYITTMELITVSEMGIWTSLSCVCTLHSMYMCVFLHASGCAWVWVGVLSQCLYMWSCGRMLRGNSKSTLPPGLCKVREVVSFPQQKKSPL